MQLMTWIMLRNFLQYQYANVVLNIKKNAANSVVVTNTIVSLCNWDE
jgi:hypothetical protein